LSNILRKERVARKKFSLREALREGRIGKKEIDQQQGGGGNFKTRLFFKLQRERKPTATKGRDLTISSKKR